MTTHLTPHIDQMLLFEAPPSHDRTFECTVKIVSLFDRRPQPVVSIVLEIMSGEFAGRPVSVDASAKSPLIRSFYDALSILTPSCSAHNLIGRRLTARVTTSGSRLYHRVVDFARSDSRGESGVA